MWRHSTLMSRKCSDLYQLTSGLSVWQTVRLLVERWREILDILTGHDSECQADGTVHFWNCRYILISLENTYIIDHLRKRCGQLRTLNDLSKWLLVGPNNRHVTLAQIMSTFKPVRLVHIFLSFHEIWEQKIHLGYPVSTITLDTVPYLDS